MPPAGPLRSFRMTEGRGGCPDHVTTTNHRMTRSPFHRSEGDLSTTALLMHRCVGWIGKRLKWQLRTRRLAPLLIHLCSPSPCLPDALMLLFLTFLLFILFCDIFFAHICMYVLYCTYIPHSLHTLFFFLSTPTW